MDNAAEETKSSEEVVVEKRELTEMEVRIAAYLSKRTALWSEKNGYGPQKPVKKMSKKAKKIADIIDNSDFGCRSEYVAELVSAIVDEEIKITTDESDSIMFGAYKGAIIVPVTGQGGHNYALNMPTMNRGSSSNLFPDKSRHDSGNSMSTSKSAKDAIRPATDEEIADYIREIGTDKIESLLNTTFV